MAIFGSSASTVFVVAAVLFVLVVAVGFARAMFKGV
jgi:hypothetical protein